MSIITGFPAHAPLSREGVVRKERRDLLILCYMARRLASLLEPASPALEGARSWLHMVLEHNNRAHRIAIYQPGMLRAGSALSFVGFVSKRNTSLDPALVDEVSRIDQEMLANVGNVPGLVSYSSFELRPYYWYNLVLFKGKEMRTHLRGMIAHTYAAYELAPAYYDWIRLHQGTLSGDLERLRLHSTRYYTFAGTPPRASSVELIYDEDK